MIDFLAAIVSHTPLWVWIVLAMIVRLGAAQMRTRDVAAARVVLVPALLAAFSLWGATSAFGRAGAALVLAAWLAGAALGWASNRALDLPRRVDANADGSFRVGGSIAPLVLMLAVFLLRYVNGVAIAIDRPLATTPWYAIAATLAFAAPTGLYAARARKIWMSRRAGGVLSAA